MNVIILYTGLRTPLGMIQHLLRFAATESPLCGNRLQTVSLCSDFSHREYRYLTKICDQVVALLSAQQSASINWRDEGSDTESVDMDVGETDRLFTFEVAKTNEKDEGAVSRPGFQVHSLPSCVRPNLTH